MLAKRPTMMTSLAMVDWGRMARFHKAARMSDVEQAQSSSAAHGLNLTIHRVDLPTQPSTAVMSSTRDCSGVCAPVGVHLPL